MSLFAVYCSVLLLIAVSIGFMAVSGDDDTTAKNDRINTVVGLQSLDWGDFTSKPQIDTKALRSMQLCALDDLVEKAYAGLQCSYLYFAMSHMHIVETYMSDPMNLTKLFDEETASIVCTDESAAILALVHGQDGQDVRWKDIRSVMWIFHAFAERTASYLRSFRIKSHVFNERSVVYAYNSVRVLLAEFSSASGCKAYDPVNGTLEDYADRLRSIVIGGRRSARQEALDNKKRFWKQTDRNAASGWVPRDTGRFTLDRLLVDNLLYNAGAMGDLLAFGLEQLNWQPIVTWVRSLHDRAVNGTIYLTEHVRALGRFQRECVRMLASVAIQVVVKEMLHLELTMSEMWIATWTVYAYNDCNGVGKEIANQLALFAEHLLLLVDDPVFSRVIGSTDRRALCLSCVIHNRVYNLLMYLHEMYPLVDLGVDFRKPTERITREYITQSTNAILEIARRNQLKCDITGNNDSPVLVQVFVEYIIKITGAVDFDILYSFGQLPASSVFGRFAEIEKEEINKQLLRLGASLSHNVRPRS